MELGQQLKSAIRNMHDYPKKGVVFRDLTTLWKNAGLMRRTNIALHRHYVGKKIEKVVGIEARGFIVGAPLADRLGVGFVPIRKLGKLPHKKMTIDYELEYGKQGLEIHRDSLTKGERVLLVDDLLATGGTAAAGAALVERLHAKVAGFAFLVELRYLNGRERLKGYDVFSLARYDSAD